MYINYYNTIYNDSNIIQKSIIKNNIPSNYYIFLLVVPFIELE